MECLRLFLCPFFLFVVWNIYPPPLGAGNLLNKPSLIKLGRGILNLIFQFFIFFILGITTYYIVKGQWLIAFKVNGPLWFLLVLIMDKVIFYFLLVRPRYQTIVAVIFIGLWGWYVGYHGHNYLYLGAAATSLPFYAMGHYMKKWLIDDKFNFYRCLSAFIIWFVCFYLFFRPQNIALNMITQNPITFYLAAISGSIVVVEFCKCIRVKWMLPFGKYSIIPMCTHWPILLCIQQKYNSNSFYEWCLILIITFVLSYLSIVLFVNRWWDVTKIGK